MRDRWLLIGTIVVAIAQCGWWILGGWVLWDVRGLMLQPDSPYIAVNARFALAVLVVAAINVFGLVAFLLRPAGWGGLLLIAVLLGNIGFSAGMWVYKNDIGWFLLGAVPATMTLVLLLLQRLSSRAATA